MEYSTFKEYWEAKKDLYTQLGVTEAVAHNIWCDAVDCLGAQLEKKIRTL